jgi:hypothetical protein
MYSDTSSTFAVALLETNFNLYLDELKVISVPLDRVGRSFPSVPMAMRGREGEGVRAREGEGRMSLSGLFLPL